jgi:hypothetical protein
MYLTESLKQTIDKTLQFAVHTDDDPYWVCGAFFSFAFYEFLDHVK